VSQKTVQNCFCQNFVKFPPILIIFCRKMAKRLKLCEVHSFSTSSNSRHNTTVLNADVRNCYTTLEVVISSKLSNDLNSTSKVNVVYLAVRITVRFKIVRIYARSGPHVHGHTTTPQKTWSGICSITFSVASSHLRRHGNMSLYRVEGVKMRCCLLFSR